MERFEAIEGHAAGLDVVMWPHRSLGVRGLWVLMAVVAAIGFGAGIVFVAVGAWPVFGFLGLDVVAISLAFHLSYRAARLRERLSVEGDDLVLARRNPGGRVERWRFPADWVRVEHEEGEDGRGCLRLASHGRAFACGRFLAPAERAEVLEMVSAALRRRRR